MIDITDYLGCEVYKTTINGSLVLRFLEQDTTAIPVDVFVSNKRWWLDKVRYKADEMNYYAYYKEYDD